jgi:hypothetical protein
MRTPWGSCKNRYFGGTYCLHLQGYSSKPRGLRVYHPEEKGDVFLRNISSCRIIRHDISEDSILPQFLFTLYLLELEKQPVTPMLGNGCAVTVGIATPTTQISLANLKGM